MSALDLEIPNDQLLTIFTSKLPDKTRARALISLAKQNPFLEDEPQLSAAVKLSLRSESNIIRKSGLAIAVKSHPDLAFHTIFLALRSGSKSTIDEKRFALSLVPTLNTKMSAAALHSQVQELSKADPRLHLEIFEAVKAVNELPKQPDWQVKYWSDKMKVKRDSITRTYLQRYGQEKFTDELRDFIECAEGGDPVKGKAIFNTNIDAQCARCHRIGKQGSDVGPELGKVASREPALSDPSYLLRSIVAPSAEIDEKYQTTMFLLESGQTVTGVVVRETKDITVINDVSGKEIEIKNDEIEDESKQKVSIMPLAKTLTKRQIRDLVAYLKTLKKKNNKKNKK